MSAVLNSSWSDTSTNNGRLGARVYETIKDRLVSGYWSHKDRLPVEALREEFGVSKQPIMEALRLLSADGLVEIIPRVGCEVASFSHRDAIDFFSLFASFEGTIAAVAAQRRTADQLTAMAEGAAAFELLPEIVDDGFRSRRYFELNRRFHEQIHAMSGSRTMSAISRRMWDMSDFLINTTGAPHPLAASTAARHADHELIREALQRSDAAMAKELMERHILTTLQLIALREDQVTTGGQAAVARSAETSSRGG